MSQKLSEEEIKKNISLIKKTVIFSGLAMLLAGLIGLSFPEQVAATLQTDILDTTLSMVLIFVGALDVFIMPRIIDKMLQKGLVTNESGK